MNLESEITGRSGVGAPLVGAQSSAKKGAFVLPIS